jgi:hypothetical protein
MVRSITTGVDPWGRASLLSIGTTACTLGVGMTTPYSASDACSFGWSYCGCGRGSSRTGCGSGCSASFPTSGGASTTSLDSSTSAHPTSWTDVSASMASMVA